MEDQTTILIVDDEPGGREALEGVFYAQGYQLLFAENGQQAYEKALEWTPDLVLLDVMMPNMDGFEVCRKMRANPLLAEIPILIVTALDDRDSRLKGIDSGADDFITKPFDRIELRARVRTITRLNRYRRLLLEKARFAWVVEQASEGYIILDKSDHILYINRAARTLLALPMDEAATFVETFHAIIEKSFHCEPEKSWIDWGQEEQYETIPIYLIQPETENSQPIWLELKVLQLPDASNHHRLVRIREINEQISSLLGMWNFHSFLTHKLRTPVSNLTFGAEILLQHLQRLPVEETAEILRGMLASSKRLEREIDDVLKFVHIPSITRGQPPASVSDLKPIISAVAGEMRIQNFTIAFDERLPVEKYIRLSSTAVEIIFTELFENSTKFHPQLTPTVEISVQSKGQEALVLTIKDDGKSLSPFQLAHMITPYFQAEKYFTGEIDGMGLGLATVASLVWGSEGECQLSNREDSEGIVVEITLPLLENNNVMDRQETIMSPDLVQGTASKNI